MGESGKMGLGTIGTDGEVVLNSGWLVGTIGTDVENGDDEEVSAGEAGERRIAVRQVYPIFKKQARGDFDFPQNFLLPKGRLMWYNGFR